MRVCTRLLVTLLLLAPPAFAQLRVIPPDAIKATMQPPQEGMVQMGKYVFRLAPGAQIRSADNRIVLPVMIGSEQPVRYQLDANGELFRVWILSADEIGMPAPKQ